MKHTIVLFISLLLLNFTISGSKKNEERKILAAKDSITVFCSPDLYNLTMEWADEFCNLNPDIKVKVINVPKGSETENLNKAGILGFISGEYSEMYNESGWNVVVGRDVIVPIFNSKNPFLNEISQKGITLEKLAQIIKFQDKRNWGTLLNTSQNAAINLYMADDESIISGLVKLLDQTKVEFAGIKIENSEELISSVQKDPYSIGICKMLNLPDLSAQRINEGIRLLPVDRNGNGEIDYVENIYDDLNILSRGVWIGKYPKALFNNIYSISSVKPTDKTEVAFLKWVLTVGQQYLNHNGYNELLVSERQTKVDLISVSTINLIASNKNYSAIKIILFILIIFSVSALFVKRGIRYIIARKGDVLDSKHIPSRVLVEDFADIPLGLYYDKTHTWAYMEKDGLVKVGIDDFLLHITGPLTRVKMKKTGEKIRKGNHVLTIIQNGKQLNISAPISGTIKEQNRVLDTNSAIINSSPYFDGWIYRIEPADWLKEIQFLIMGKKYKEWLKSEFSRMKEFLALYVKPDRLEYAPVLQDGGELKDSILADLGPEVWEDFQTNFIDMSI
jgi:glycine cleavage system H lipoate-binding protein/ABC-type phosphate transport system substrate-binding protein